MKASEAISLIEQTMGFNMSDEQRSILVFGYGSPTLINSCAGAGKTTTLMMSILYNALIHDIDPKYVLGITFSKRAQQDMEHKYDKIIQQLVKLYELAASWGRPTFRTFHSLFLHLLKRLDHDHSFAVVNTDNYQRELYAAIRNPVGVLTRSENVARFTDVASKLVNFGYSNNGLDVNLDNPQVKIILDNFPAVPDPMQVLLTFLGHGDRDYYDSYQAVIKLYQHLKNNQAGLDFDDMQARLKHLLVMRPVQKKLGQRYLEHYQLLYLDEFQDINPLQWSLVQDLMTDEDYNHLVAIGDDDQSIYSFRGSEASFILNFTKVIPRAQKFTLSTNYRTKTEILNIVKPLIESNTLRLDKSLRAHENGGQIYRAARGHSQTKLNDDALAKLMLDVKADVDAKRTFAILSRTNLNLSLLTDQLANYDVYFNLGKSEQVLQNTKLYRILVASMKVISNNNFSGLQRMSKYFGFSNYRKYIKDMKYSSIDDYLRDPSVMKNKGYQNINKALLEARQYCLEAESNGVVASKLPKYLLMSVRDLTNNYFLFVTSHHFVSYSYDDYYQIAKYLEDEVQQFDSLTVFYQHELNKLSKMTDVIVRHDLRLQAITMHSSKGLEFDETLFYESKSVVVTDEMLHLSNLFPATLTLKSLKEKLASLSLDMMFDILIDFTSAGIGSTSRILELSPGIDADQIMEYINRYIEASKGVNRHNNYEKDLKRQLRDNHFSFAGVINNSVALKMLLMELVANAKAVEEERRIYYVAVTRAKNRIIFDEVQYLSMFDCQLNLRQAQSIYLDPMAIN